MPRIDNPKSPLVPRLQGLHLFHFEGAPCAQRVRFALAEKGLTRDRDVAWQSDAPDTLVAETGTWISRHVSLVKKDHLTDAYAAIHPNLVVPALVHDGRLYIESMDIDDYIDATWPQNRLLPDDADRAALTRSLVAQAKALHVSVRYVSFRWGLGRLGKLNANDEENLRRLETDGSPEHLVSFYERYDRGQIEEATFAEHLAALEGGYATLERLLSADGRPFLTGDSFTIADIIWSLKVLRIEECGYPFAANFPALFAWYGRVTNRPAFKEGVMSRHTAMSRTFKLKAAAANLMGHGLKQASRRQERAAGDAARAV